MSILKKSNSNREDTVNKDTIIIIDSSDESVSCIELDEKPNLIVRQTTSTKCKINNKLSNQKENSNKNFRKVYIALTSDPLNIGVIKEGNIKERKINVITDKIQRRNNVGVRDYEKTENDKFATLQKFRNKDRIVPKCLRCSKCSSKYIKARVEVKNTNTVGNLIDSRKHPKDGEQDPDTCKTVKDRNYVKNNRTNYIRNNGNIRKHDKFSKKYRSVSDYDTSLENISSDDFVFFSENELEDLKNVEKEYLTELSKCNTAALTEQQLSEISLSSIGTVSPEDEQ